MLTRITIAAVVSFALFVASCKAHTPEEAKALWVLLAKTFAVGEVVPDDEPVSDICTNCDGKGKVGDGTIERICPVCDGTGKITSATMPVVDWWPPAGFDFDSLPPRNAEIVVYTRNDCAPCRALEYALPELESLGWSVSRVYTNWGVTPRTQVWVRGNSQVITGYGGRDDFFRRIKSFIGELRSKGQ